MSNRRMLMLGSLAAFTAAGALAACESGDDDVTPVTTDGGTDQQSPEAGPQDAATDSDSAAPTGLNKIGHFVVIYMENHSFDNLYGEFPGAEGLGSLDASAPNVAQVDQTGTPYAQLPMNAAGFPSMLPNAPFPIENYIASDASTADLHHLFYTEQFQINDGGMNRFTLWSNSEGLTQGYYHTAGLPLAQLAKSYTVCDHFFHSAFGGSFLNHQWLIAAQTPTYPGTVPTDAGMFDDPSTLTFGVNENPVSLDGHLVNTCFSVNSPHPDFSVAPVKLIPNLTNTTIGDRLSAASLDWAWYSEGWNEALQYSADGGIPDGSAGPVLDNFQYHHQPFVYYANYADGTAAKAAHLKDEADMLTAAASGTLPPVVFYKPVGIENEHPGYANVEQGELHVVDIINKLKASPNYADMAIIVTYDEHGGFWDHVAPPVIDQWGPGSRVPAVIISPFAKANFVDHTQYETVSILATIEKRFGLMPLSTRDKNATVLTNAFNF